MLTYDVPPLTPYGEVEKVEFTYSNDYYDEFNDIFDYNEEEIEEKEDDKIMKPLDKIEITSGYGKRTYTYNGKKITDFHHGVDIVGGKKIYATADGKVVKVVNKGEKGGTMCLVRIQHKDYQSAYYHIKSGSARVKKGQWVKKGDWIATIGNTGKVTGTHLHFQIDKGTNATSINPTDYAKGKKELEGLRKPAKDWQPGDYKVLYAKYKRKTAEVKATNKIKYDTMLPDEKEKCTKDKLGYAKYKPDVILYLSQFTTDKKNNIWGKNLTSWLCVSDSTGYQVDKV